MAGIIPGQNASANEVLLLAGLASADYISDVRVMGYAFQTSAQNRYAIIYDGDVTEFNTLQADDWVAGFEVLSASSDVNTGITTMQYSLNVGYFAATLLDDFEDASISTVKWSTTVAGTGTVTETSGYAEVNSGNTSAKLFSKGSGPGLDCKLSNCSIIIDVTDNFAGGGTSKIIMTDDTIDIDLIEIINSGSHNRDGIYEVYVDSSGETAIVRTKIGKSGNWSTWSATIDISSLGSNFYIGFEAINSGSQQVIRVYDVWFVQGAVTQVIQSSGYDHIQTSTDLDGVITLGHGIFTVNKDLNGATPTWSISTNNGSNFTTLNENEITTIGNPSNQLVLKGSIQSTATRPAYIYEFGVKAWD